MEALTDAGVPAGLVNDVAEALAFAESLGLDPVVELGASRTVANPIALSAPPPTTAPRRRASTSTPAPTGFPTSEKGPTA